MKEIFMELYYNIDGRNPSEKECQDYLTRKIKELREEEYYKSEKDKSDKELKK